MPGLTRAQREIAPPPPAPRIAWYCPRCAGRRVPMGYAQNPHAAYLAGVRHYDAAHRHTDDERAAAIAAHDEAMARARAVPTGKRRTA